MTPCESSLDRERRLDEAVAQYLAAQAEGRCPDRDQWLAQFPDLAGELAEFLSDLEGMQRAVERIRGAAARPPAHDAIAPGLPTDDKRLAQTLVGDGVDSAPRGGSTRYRLERFHARGGMGEVWLAEDLRIGRRIAVKRLRSAGPGARERFLHEAQITGQLEHPGIVPLHDLETGQNGEPFYVMKFVEGRSFKEVIAEFHAAKSAADWPGSLACQRLLKVFVDVCHAVAYAHDRGVLHRDIKPENIMLGRYGEAMLLDWGLAKVLGQPDGPEGSATPVASDSPAGTRAGDVLGSLMYMPPEFASGNAAAADERTDVYLLGATLYEILTGRAPRSGSSQVELIALARAGSVEPPRKLDPHVPRPLEAICLKAMHRDPDQRYASAAALAEDVEHSLARDPVSAYPEPLRQRAWRWVRRHRRGLQRVATGVLLCSLAAVAIGASLSAQSLAHREASRRDLEAFRRLGDEARFFAASTDAVAERAPYYDPRRALAAGKAALEIAAPWGTQAERLPFPAERAELVSELYGLLLILASAQDQADQESQGPPQALALLDRAAALGGTTHGYHQLRARCLARLGRVAESRAEAKRADDPDTTLAAMDHFLAGEDHRTRTAASGNPATEPASAADREAISQAVEEYRQALRLDPQHYWAQFQLARCYLRLGRVAEAVQALGTCVALRPDAPWAYSTRGLAYGLIGQFDDAQADLDRALRLDPDFLPARLHRGYVSWLRNRPREAMADFEAVLQAPAERRLPEAAWYRGQLHWQNGDGTRALEDCDAVISQRPGFRPAYWLRAKVRFGLGQEAAGLQDLNAFLALGSDPLSDAENAAACIARGRALRELAVGLDGSPRDRVLDLALLEFQQALDRGAPAEDVSPDLLAIPQLAGQMEQAVEALTHQLAASPEDLGIRKQRAWAYASLRQPLLAEEDFRAVLRKSPLDPEARAGLGYVLAVRGAISASDREAVRALLHGGNNYLVLHSVACIYAELSQQETDRSRDDEDLALTLATRAVELYRQHPNGPDEIAFLRQEPAFPPSLRAREEFKKLLGESAP